MSYCTCFTNTLSYGIFSRPKSSELISILFEYPRAVSYTHLACLLHQSHIEDYAVLEKHQLWYQELEESYVINEDNVDNIIAESLTRKFVNVLEDAGVFKMNEEGIDAFISFVKDVYKRQGLYIILMGELLIDWSIQVMKI